MQNRTKIKQQLVIEQLKSTGGNVELSCLNVNANRQHFYVWLKKYPEFKNEVEEVYTNLIKYTKSKIYLKALKQDLSALKIIKDQSEKKLNKLRGDK